MREPHTIPKRSFTQQAAEAIWNHYWEDEVAAFVCAALHYQWDLSSAREHNFYHLCCLRWSTVPGLGVNPDRYFLQVINKHCILGEHLCLHPSLRM